MAKKKQPEKEKSSGKKKPKSGVVDYFAAFLEQILSYFELLFVYYRKKFNENTRKSIALLIGISYFFFWILAGSGFIFHAVYELLKLQFPGNNYAPSLVLGSVLLLIAGIFIRILLKRVIF